MQGDRYDDERLLAEFEAAERQLKEHPELLDNMKVPENEFELIMEKVRLREVQIKILNMMKNIL